MSRNTIRKKFLMFCITLCFLILYLYTFNETTSRYTEQISSSDSVIAVPILTIDNNSMEYDLTDMIPGDEEDYEFIVSNYENGRINEVLLDYTLKAEVGSELPLRAEIYDITDGEEKLELTDGKTEKIRMNFGTEISRKYRLKIIWDASENSFEYANKKTQCKVILEAEQVV